MTREPERQGSPDRPFRDGEPGVVKHYERPELIEYGHVGKLTQTGGVTRMDMGMKRMCL